MIAYSDPAGPKRIVTATVTLPWPVNDTAQGTIRAMQNAVVAALRDAGTPTASRPAYQDLRRAETGYLFVFTAPVQTPEPTQEGVTP